MNSRYELNMKVGLFVTIGATLLMVAIILLGGADSIFVRRIGYNIHFKSVDGLMIGSKVVLNGIRVGVISKIGFDQKRDNIRVDLAIERAYGHLIRKDTSADIATQGVLGDKYISLIGGSKEQEALEPSGEIPTGVGPSGGLLSNTGQLMQSLGNVANGLDRLIRSIERDKRSDVLFEGLALTAKNMAAVSEKLNREFDQIKIKATIGQLHAILEKINNGTGTAGALVNDPGLYDDVKNLIGGANRNRVVRNLIRQNIRNNEEAVSAEEAPAVKVQKK